MNAITGPWSHGADLHFHLLPGVDDGPATMGDTLELALAAVADRTGTVVATPHVRSDLGVTEPLELEERVREVQDALDSEGVCLTVRAGGELGHDMVGRLGQLELDAIAQGPPGCRWLLVEAPFEGMGEDFHAATGELRDRGFGVVIAHPERTADAVLDRAQGLRRELADGALAQLNALSFSGGHGPDAEWAAFELLSRGMAAIVGSDAHGPTRPPALSIAHERLLRRGVAPAVARTLTVTRPWRLLARGLGPRAVLAA
jgi:protein-tyrosine phosphatase